MVNIYCFMMFRMFLTTQLMLSAHGQKCMVEQHEVDGECCYPCHSGYKLHGMCSIMRGTMCVPCDPGTYTAHENVLKKCFQCKVCDPELGLVTRRECSSTSNTVCSCSSGYFCTDTKDDNCEKCVGPRVCSPGQYVKSRGTTSMRLLDSAMVSLPSFLGDSL
ncbi:tumor necrosis factor receptor superfamily member 14-like [Sarcophilus harrisii]